MDCVLMVEKDVFAPWVNQVVEEARSNGISETQLAKNIGISQSLLNAYRLKSRKPPSNKAIIDAFITYFKDSHPEVYAVFEVKPSNPISSFPQELRSALASANEKIILLGLTNNEQAAMSVIYEAIKPFRFIEIIKTLDDGSTNRDANENPPE